MKIDLDHGESIEFETDLDYWSMIVVDACPHEACVTIWTVDQRIAIARALVTNSGWAVVESASVMTTADRYATAAVDAAKPVSIYDGDVMDVVNATYNRDALREELRALVEQDQS